MDDAGDTDAEQQWDRRLSTAETVLWYGIAFVSYISVSIFEKGLLNWIVGPLWLVGVVVFGPRAVDRLRGRR